MSTKYKMTMVLSIIGAYVLKFIVQGIVYDLNGEGIFFSNVSVQLLMDIMLATIFPSIVLIVAVLVRNLTASRIIAIINIPFTILILVIDAFYYSIVAMADIITNVGYLVNVVVLALTIVHVVMVGKERKAVNSGEWTF
ncbi:MAG: hypothetical protein MJ166_07150 [Clostridia bacterium]|nr:hypothetical protein [Clostridia bacterium]